MNRSLHWNLTQIQMWFKLDFFWAIIINITTISPFDLLVKFFFHPNWPKLTLLGAWVTHFATLSNNYCLHGIDSKFEVQMVDGNSFQNTQIVCILSFNLIFFMAFNINLIFSPPIFMFLHVCKIGDFLKPHSKLTFRTWLNKFFI